MFLLCVLIKALLPQQHGVDNGIKKIRRDFLKKQKICLDKMYIHNVCFRERIRIISARISTNEEERRYEEWCRQFYG